MSTTLTKLDLDQLFVTTMRTLAIDAIQQANSGHPGTPMGMSPTFGASAPLKLLQKEFGFSAAHVVEAAKAQLGLVK